MKSQSSSGALAGVLLWTGLEEFLEEWSFHTVESWPLGILFC